MDGDAHSMFIKVLKHFAPIRYGTAILELRYNDNNTLECRYVLTRDFSLSRSASAFAFIS